MEGLRTQLQELLQSTEGLLHKLKGAEETIQTLQAAAPQGILDPWVVGLSVFILACFVGYYVVWHVTPALHSPLMAVTNAISSVIIVGALLSVGASTISAYGLLGIFLAAINIFGGFMVTKRMLDMFSKSKR